MVQRFTRRQDLCFFDFRFCWSGEWASSSSTIIGSLVAKFDSSFISFAMKPIIEIKPTIFTNLYYLHLFLEELKGALREKTAVLSLLLPKSKSSDRDTAPCCPHTPPLVYWRSSLNLVMCVLWLLCVLPFIYMSSLCNLIPHSLSHALH